MAVAISVKSNVKEVLRDYKGLRRDIKTKAIVRALNKSASKANTQVRRRIANESGLKQSYIKRKMQVIKASGLTLTAGLGANDQHALTLAEWASKAEIDKHLSGETKRRRTKTGRKRKRTPGLKHNAWKRRQTTKGVFIIKGANSGKPIAVKRRKGRRAGRGWSETAYGPVVWREFARYAREEVTKAVNLTFSKEFERQVRLALNRRK